MKKIPLVLCGLGTVGSGVVRLLQSHEDLIAQRLGAKLELVQVGARRANPSCGLGEIERVEDVLLPAEHKEAKILIELLGGVDTAYELTCRAFKSGKSVITANKALIAEKGNQLMELAQECGVHYAYEAAVGGGIPIIKALREGLASNHIHRLSGIINGTANFILSHMTDENLAFPVALEMAQQNGYAEADPSFDINGVDSAHKLQILSSLAFAIPLANMEVYQEGIDSLSPEELQYAYELGYIVKHLAIAERFSDNRLSLRVHPALLHKDKILAQIAGVTNGIMVESFPLGTSFYIGPGAGGDATASAVVADLMDMVRCPSVFASYQLLKGANYVPIDAIASEFYVRINAKDETGVMAKLTQILSDEKIGIEALHQQEPKDSPIVPIIIITHKTTEEGLSRAIQQMERLDEVTDSIVRLRIADLPL